MSTTTPAAVSSRLEQAPLKNTITNYQKNSEKTINRNKKLIDG
jgi:hypothetical protein